MKIGKYEIKIILSGFFSLDGGAMFGIVPKPLWEKTNPSDSLNRVKLATRNLLLQSESKNILIDTGMGNKWTNKEKEIYAVDENISLEASLIQYNIKKEDITDVILTHLHFDHTGGSVTLENDRLIPAFPNAKYHVQKKNFEWAKNPSDRDKGSYIKQNFIPLFENGVLNLIDSEAKFDDEIEFLVINGHTFGQQMVKVSDSSNTLLFCSDLIPFVSHIPVPYIMGYDIQPLITVEEKKIYLQKALEENWKLFFGHDPETAMVTLKSTEKGIRVNERFDTI
jgi:glyoxylase-like metal-dependent hydrolase (beta-lactamase superfamily II)